MERDRQSNPSSGVITNQSGIDIDTSELRQFLLEAMSVVPESGARNVSLALVTDETMRDINKGFRGTDATTDVLSFPFDNEAFERDNFSGEIVISVKQAKIQADENGLPLLAEIKQLILHGLLHLAGLDHETDDGEMNSLELELRDKLKVNR